MSAIPDYQDAGHRPHARHDGEVPRNEIKDAPYHLSVTLDTWGPVDNLFPNLYDKLVSNWGDAPSRKSMPVEVYDMRVTDTQPDRTGWESLTPAEKAYVESCFAGKTLTQVLENITFSFLIDGCTRACTHQIVRARIGAGFMQHGGRDNDWRHRPWVMPETIRRACLHDEGRGTTSERWDGRELRHCITDWEPIERLLCGDERYRNLELREAIEDYLNQGRAIYAALVDAGIPWEDARRVLWMGTSTYIHADYNYLALQGLLARRLEFIMDWEINCVAQLMKREITMKCPPLFAKYLRSASDIKGQAAFAGLQSWPPDGKYPNPYERCGCGHAKGNHLLETGHGVTLMKCEVCERDGLPEDTISVYHNYTPVDSLPREHRPEQNPFFILSPESMAGGPIKWIATNGSYPQELKPDSGRG